MPEPRFLESILAACRERLEAIRARVPLAQVEEAAERRAEGLDRRDFAAAISGNGLSVIAELKQASPSRGVLRQQYHPRELAQGYEAGGATALSVLTEERFFGGSLTDLIDARDATGLPVLRKDFILDPYQVYESIAAGADALLLIVAILPDRELRNLIELARGSRIAALVEVHTERELHRALDAEAQIIGVNNRDLGTFSVDLETSLRLREHIPSACFAVSESGIKTAADLTRLRDAGYDAVLIGEQFMTAKDPGRALAAILRSAKFETRNSKPAI